MFLKLEKKLNNKNINLMIFKLVLFNDFHSLIKDLNLFNS